ncbi:unnamed protein product [Adineta steineri]|uniref:Transmembrane protein 107 n=3 Tax=Adineta steineri TaxID=433720 RepID=A0A815MM07_9BILA|nr:unnamed protein product [Adineta steineri]CAF1427910.1 unnamed protein product [Adineta steineri]CAF3890845.1 unnamed protein product [Adineta steineri]CAF3891465.1 unnamed protein product [Adineta steineri]CAF4276021.1 unnamed protein product [Adineta steineri]
MYLRIISARFLSHVLHVLAIGLCFWSWERNAYACRDDGSFISYRNQLYVAHSLAIAFCVFELIPLILGITSITFSRSFLAIILHLSAAIGLAFFLLQHQCALRIWPIFAICSCVPFIIECTAAIYKTIRQRL